MFVLIVSIYTGKQNILTKISNHLRAYFMEIGLFVSAGDVGEWLPDGSLRIIDRCKNMFKLAQGEYIAPDKLEVSRL